MRLNDSGSEKETLDVSSTKEKLDKAYNLNLVDDAAKAAQESVNGILVGAVAGLVGAYFF